MYIRPEFEKELKKLKIKTVFIKNFNDQFKGLRSFDDVKGTYKKVAKERKLAQLNAMTSFRMFIIYAFTWKNTPQGHDFWWDIFKKAEGCY